MEKICCYNNPTPDITLEDMDLLVYKLYGLTEEEIGILEGAVDNWTEENKNEKH